MKNLEIKLLQQQITKLEDKNFNLEAWKTGTILLLERIFGPGNLKIKKIEEIHYELSSWSMRDNLAESTEADSCKRIGKAILEASIMELVALGTADSSKKSTKETVSFNSILNPLEEELKISELKELRKILSETPDTSKQAKVIDLLNKWGHDRISRILSLILTSEDVLEEI